MTIRASASFIARTHAGGVVGRESNGLSLAIGDRIRDVGEAQDSGLGSREGRKGAEDESLGEHVDGCVLCSSFGGGGNGCGSTSRSSRGDGEDCTGTSVNVGDVRMKRLQEWGFVVKDAKGRERVEQRTSTGMLVSKEDLAYSRTPVMPGRSPSSNGCLAWRKSSMALPKAASSFPAPGSGQSFRLPSECSQSAQPRGPDGWLTWASRVCHILAKPDQT